MSWRVRGYRRLMWSMVGGWLALMVVAGSAAAAPCYDWSRSIEPARIQSVATGSACRLDGNTAYVAGARLWIVDVGGTGEPAFLNSVVLPAAAQDLALADGLAYVACGAAGVVEIDVHSPSQAAIVRTYTPASPIVAVVNISGRVIARDNASGLHVLDTAAGAILGAAFVAAWPEPILAMCEAGGFLILSEARKIVALNVRSASALTTASTLEREFSSLAQLCSDGSALFELSGHIEPTPDGWANYLVAQMARFEVSSIGGLARDSAAAPVKMGEERITARDGMIVAISASQSASLWSADTFEFLGRLSSTGNAADIDGGRVIASGSAGLAVTDGLSQQPLPPMQMIHGEPFWASGDSWPSYAVERRWPWILKTTTTSSYEPGYWGGTTTWQNYTLAWAGSPTAPVAATSGVAIWSSSSAFPDDPCAWGGVWFIGQTADCAVIWARGGCYVTVTAVSGSQSATVATMRLGPYYRDAVASALAGNALWVSVLPFDWDDTTPNGRLTRYELGASAFHTVGAFDIEGPLTATVPDADLLIMIRADRFEAYDTSDPSLLVPVSNLDLPASVSARPMAWLGRQLLYAHEGVLRVLDFADPANPQLRSQTTLLAQPDDLRLDGNRLLLRYGSEWTGGVVPQFQIGYVDPLGAVELQAPIITSFRFQEIALCGETAYVDDGSYLHAYDLTDPASPRHVGVGPRGNGNLDCAGDYIGSGTVIVPRDCRDLKPPRPVRIEVRPTLKPGDPSGYSGPALIPVAVLGDGLFDPSTLDETSLRFGPLEAATVPGPGAARAKQTRTPRSDGAVESLEALFWFPLGATGIGADAAPLRLTGRTLSGEEVLGIAPAQAMPAAGPVPDIAIEAAPNPFNPSTTLRFHLAASGPARLTIRNLRGETVRTLIDEVRAAGDQAVVWDGRDEQGGRVASGVYLVSVEAGGTRATSRIALLK